MSEKTEVLVHSSIKISGEKNIYIDPFKINNQYSDADFIFITHDHYDHYSEQDIEKVKKGSTIYIIPKTLTKRLQDNGVMSSNILSVEPNKTYTIHALQFETIPAYNINKKFHPKENGWVGYIINLNGTKYYIAGDTDITEESKQVKCDIALVPVGGTYTMTASEAAELVNIIKPKIAIPMHYGDIVGTPKDGEIFINLLDKSISGVLGIYLNR